MAERAPSAVINQTMARVYYGNQCPIGRRESGPEGGPGQPETYRTIVGVVEDVKNAGLDKRAGTELYLPYAQDYARQGIYLVVRSAGDPESLISGVRNAVHGWWMPLSPSRRSGRWTRWFKMRDPARVSSQRC